jgi:hypothetical protein
MACDRPSWSPRSLPEAGDFRDALAGNAPILIDRVSGQARRGLHALSKSTWLSMPSGSGVCVRAGLIHRMPGS